MIQILRAKDHLILAMDHPSLRRGVARHFQHDRLAGDRETTQVRLFQVSKNRNGLGQNRMRSIAFQCVSSDDDRPVRGLVGPVEGGSVEVHQSIGARPR